MSEPSGSVVEQIRAGARAGGLLVPGRPVLVLLSGGRDSTCLIDLSCELAGAGAVSALHVNYGLRASADADQRACELLCGALGVRLSSVRAPPAPSGNTQAWARELRYRAGRELAAGADIAVGHTATDQVETILYRLASSPSRRALLGMRARDGAIVRPLLGFSREQTTQYCRERQLSWCEDETNSSDTYARNRVRRGLLVALREIHPGAERNVLALAQTLREEAAVLDSVVDEALQGRSEIRLAALRGLPIGIGRMVVQRLADEAAGGPAPGTARRLEEILALDETATAHLDLPHGVRASVAGGVLTFSLK